MASSQDRNPNEGLGFNTIRNSSISKRRKNATLQKYTCLTVLALIGVIVCLLVVMAIGGIITNVSDNGDKPNTDPGGQDVEWGSLSMSATDTQQGPLVLVNASHQYTFPATDEHLMEIYAAYAKHSPRVYMLSGLSKFMDKTALTALDAMLVDFAAATGKNNILIHYAYRTAEDQEAIGSSIAPGYSDHHTGLGCVLKYRDEDKSANYDLSADPTYAWIAENCHKYGFVVRYPADKGDDTGVADYESYFRYVGVAHATYMKEKNLCLEEYVSTLKGYTREKPLTINGADGNKYEVYYVAVNGSATVKYPTNFAYTISGTNEGGVVITVNRSQAINDVESDTAANTATGS